MAEWTKPMDFRSSDRSSNPRKVRLLIFNIHDVGKNDTKAIPLSLRKLGWPSGLE